MMSFASTGAEKPGAVLVEVREPLTNGEINQPHQVRRRVRILLSGVLSVLLLLWSISRRPIVQIVHREESVQERTARILSETPLIDGHNDLAILIRGRYSNHIYNDTFKQLFENGAFPGHVDLPRLRKGSVGGAFWSVFWPCPEHGADFSDEIYYSTVRDTFRQTDLMQRLQQLFPSDFAVTTSSAAAVRAFKEGRLISPLGVEGLHQIGNSAATLRQFYALGARYVTLNHNCPNKYSDAALWERPFRKAPPYWGGVSVAGRDMVHEMNRLGMLVDLSHTSDDTQIDVLGGGKRWTGSRAPVIFSHSSAYALCPHPRNVKDHVLQLVRKRDSLVMVNFAPDFVSCVESGNENGLPSYYPGNSTLEHVVDHIMHIGELIGYDHVGIGSDFDGINSTPRGLEDVSKFPKLIEELLRRGVSDQDAAKVAGGNILRVWKAAEDVAAEMQAANAPILEDDV